MLRSAFLLLPAFFAALAAGCAGGPSRPEDDTPANVTLLLSNRSADRPSVDITVEVDGAVVARGRYEGGTMAARQAWIRQALRIGPGSHMVRANSRDGEATIEKEIRIEPGKGYALAVGYFCSAGGPGEPVPPHLDVELRDQPLLFR